VSARGIIGLAVGLIAAVAIYWMAGRLEGDAPSVVVPEAVLLGSAGGSVTLHIQDDGTGLRRFTARLLHAAGSQSIFEESYPGGLLTGRVGNAQAREVNLELDVDGLGLPDGPATLVVSVRDWSWRDGFAGNRSEISVPITIDLRPPGLSVASGLTYVYRGGSAAAIYRLEEDVSRDGVRVGDQLFRGYPHPSGEARLRVALFSIPIDAAKTPEVYAFAVDAAGNLGERRFSAHVLERVFGTARIEIESAFVERVAAPLADAMGLARGPPAETFREVNEALRARNEASIRDAIAESAPEPLFRGGFEQMRGSKVMSRFAEQRTYTLDGTEISTTRHYGFDLASTRQAAIQAAAAGVVVHAGPLGIYGQCVIVDHGLGLASLYGHLSEVATEVGARVERGDALGRSGSTGLAAGDHLHFAILVGEHYVDPLEWWDPRWVRSHVEVRLEPSTR